MTLFWQRVEKGKEVIVTCIRPSPHKLGWFCVEVRAVGRHRTLFAHVICM